MKNKIIYLLAITLIVAATACQQGGSVKEIKLESPLDSASYAIGILVGANNKQQLASAPGGADMNLEIMASAFRLASLEEETVMTQDEANEIIRVFFESAGEKAGQSNLEEGNAFLETNKAREEITVTESGLQYEILTEGTGAKPTLEDQVRVHYHGTLIDGTVFDSSVDRGEPAVFGVGQVIPGWTEALQLMPTGSKWKVYLPSAIAYGERGAGGDIGPNAALIFEVELLEIVK
ncbi:MAG: FKBP-type peptidyl-prolyl cis-trans isomerase [Prolixibacteraceae bacterium]|jgi:FKBP-type peptidyl-prolyl cis-trans isomerase|nr:FKBP-type peptidyl-prolyl cis-trans isomerase [Prolixibacteraceae bacterium]MBT6005731.1 FKBP-type peptidyl-prolyl cis-trans isomerase [Prolixibacteraceae bacterium]MBT6763325.1 FKBP-type peptidyl-prolyl cis-trans isomerase [Prolixibacteraceae bacterium]MBT6999439.1 FKBP-type peptidyl-prolyl cis-trans isomerase [Prolixibacteraceae bacterium]MBT7394786.1 FKBP-type peptidyl-prolyl cis-trans isomerase [Prolixibacteraceae bacterium]